MIFNIVTNSKLEKMIMKIDIFSLDLGKSMLNRKTQTIQIKDNFVEVYSNIHGRFIHKYGSIGDINFYSDLRIPLDEIHIYGDNKVFELQYDSNDLPIKQFISESLRRIETHIINSNNEIPAEMAVDESKKSWVAKDGKNDGKEYVVNQRLSREEYMKELMSRKNK